MTDVAVNLAVLAALLLEHFFGWSRADAIGALAISLYMLWNARGMAAHALVQLLDQKLEHDARKQIQSAVLGCEGVYAMHDLRTRNGGDRVFVEFHLEVDEQLTVRQGHAVADRAEAAVVRLFSRADVIAHVEPAGIIDVRLDDIVNDEERSVASKDKGHP